MREDEEGEGEERELGWEWERWVLGGERAKWEMWNVFSSGKLKWGGGESKVFTTFMLKKLLKFQNQSGVVFECLCISSFQNLSDQSWTKVHSVVYLGWQFLVENTPSKYRHKLSVDSAKILVIQDVTRDRDPGIVILDVGDNQYLTCRLGCSKISPSQFQTEERPGISWPANFDIRTWGSRFTEFLLGHWSSSQSP